MANIYNFITRPIGDMFYVDKEKEVLLQVEEGTCRGCYFYHPSNNGKFTVSCMDFDIIGICQESIRDDGKNVHFVEVKPEPELNLCGDCTSSSC